MSRPIVVEEDYRKRILGASPAREAELRYVPDKANLAMRAAHYAPIIDEFIPPDRGASVLELGCGWGPFLAALHQRGYTRLAAVEMLPECCALVKEMTGVEPVRADIFDFLSQAEGPYDVIAAFDVVEHFRKNEIVAMLERIRELLRPGGVFVMRVPNCASLGGLATLHSGFTHETAFTPLSADELLRALDFANVRCIPEPIFARTRARTVLKRAMMRAFGQVLSLSTAAKVAPRFVVSSNLIAGGSRR